MRGRAIAVAGSVAAIAAATGLIYALRPITPVLSLGVLYVLAVMIAAILWGAAYAVPVAVVSMLAYNFFFLPPLLTLRLADGRNWTALGVYVATAVIVSDLATRARGRAAEAEQRGRETALLRGDASRTGRTDHRRERGERRRRRRGGGARRLFGRHRRAAQ